MDGYGITTFCDDIRFEQYGKLTLVGCYGSLLVLNGDFPYVMPRLGIFVQLRFQGTECKAPTQIRVFLPSDTTEPAHIVEIPPSTEENTIMIGNPSIGNDIIPQMATNVPIIFENITIENEGYIRVRVYRDGEILKVGALKISKSSS